MDVYDINNASSTSSSSSIGYSSNMVEEQHHVDDDDVDDDNMFELSDLMSQLPIKRGLSKYYNGKSDSFKNLITLKSLEDVPKNMSYRFKKKKNMKQDNNNNNNNKKYSFTITPKSKISKTNNKVSKKASMKDSILMNTWNVTSTNGLNNSIHV